MRQRRLEHADGFTISAAQQWCSRDATERHHPGFARSHLRSAGFTIVELMIATMVFSAILLLITTGVLYFSRSYYSGINRSTTQNTAREIITGISQGIQFTGTAISSTTTDASGVNYFCAGSKIYVFRPGVQYQGGTASSANPGLYVAPAPSGCASPSSLNYNNAQAQQLLGKGMRIASLTVTGGGTNQMYAISLTLAYGDNDLLCAPQGVINSCTSNGTLSNSQLKTKDVTCKPQTGSQFCAASSLNATVQKRVQGS